MTLRRNPITGDPVLFAPERAARPRAFTDATDESICPFCPGNESETPPELTRIGDPWRVRVFPNKYPTLPGAEVIVETADHGAASDGIEHVDDVVRMYVERYRAHAAAAYVALFKNEGTRAGASFAHVHSQVVPMPFVPLRVQREAEAFARAARCPLCGDDELLMIRETGTFCWVAPLGSAIAYQQWLIPKRHVGSIDALNDAELSDLASLLRSSYASTLAIGNSLNVCCIDFPRGSSGHFYADVFARITGIAGFELGTGTFVEIIDPAAAVEKLRR